MGKKYLNPPILEAVCEFRFTEDTPWDVSTPNRVYESLQPDFPIKEIRFTQQISLIQTPDGPKQQINTVELTLFFSPNRKTFVQIGPRLLTIHRLHPYPGWQEFNPAITTAFQALLKLIPNPRFDRIGLRYINKIQVEKQNFELVEFFDYFPYCGAKLNQQSYDEFVQIVNFIYFDGQDGCRVHFQSTPPVPPQAFILDIDYYLQQKDYVTSSTALGWVARAHDQIETIFEGCIKDPVRLVMNEVTQ